MRIARVIGTLIANPRLPEVGRGRLVIAEVLDAQALAGHEQGAPRKSPMPESLIVYDEMGAGEGQLIGISEGREATMPFYPQRVPIDAYAALILDTVSYRE